MCIGVREPLLLLVPAVATTAPVELRDDLVNPKHFFMKTH